MDVRDMISHLLAVEHPMFGLSRACRLGAILGVVACFCANSVPVQSQLSPPPTAKCGVFFDKSSAGVPPAMLAIAELGHEVMAAQICVAAKNVPSACEHWRRALKAVEGMDPAFAAANTGNIKALMQQQNCS
jgi:hypothetical protein